MKLAAKIFLCTLVVVVLALAASGYLIISSSFQNAVNRECERSLEEYQLLKFTLQSDILNATENSVVTGKVLRTLAQHTAKIAPDGNQVAIFTREKGMLYSDFPEDFLFEDLDEQAPERLMYGIRNFSKQYLLVVSGRFIQNGQEIYLYTARDVSAIVQQRQQMQRQFLLSYLLILGISAVAVMIFSAVLTKPVLQLVRVTRRISNGRYDQRAAVSTQDEIGILCNSFNKMADTIEDKISELKLNAQQKEDFVSNFAHELKTPLTSVIGYADMIYQRDLGREETREAAGYILSEGMRLEALSLKLMDLIVLGKQVFLLEEISLEQIFEDIGNTLLPVMQKNSCELEVHAMPAYVKVEYDLFKTLMLNLVDNAVKAGSTHVRIDAKRKGQDAVVTVADNGCGMKKEELSRITEAFYMVDKSRSRKLHGAGLGLSIASKIAEVHGTQLFYQSEPGKGTSVSFSLQIAEGGAQK